MPEITPFLGGQASLSAQLSTNPDLPPITLKLLFYEESTVTDIDLCITVEQAKSIALGIIATIEKSERRSKQYARGEFDHD